VSQGTIHVFPLWGVAFLLAKGWTPVQVTATPYGETAVHFPLEAKDDLGLIRRCMDEARALRDRRGVSHGQGQEG
jgi:hypothetical protein